MERGGQVTSSEAGLETHVREGLQVQHQLDAKLAVLTAEEQSLEAELSALRAAAPAPAAPAAPTPTTTSSDAAENKE